MTTRLNIEVAGGMLEVEELINQLRGSVVSVTKKKSKSTTLIFDTAEYWLDWAEVVLDAEPSVVKYVVQGLQPA